MACQVRHQGPGIKKYPPPLRINRGPCTTSCPWWLKLRSCRCSLRLPGMSATQILKRALVTLLLELARAYGLTLSLNRDSPDLVVKKAFKKVVLRVHPDKPGGSEEAAKKLNIAYSNWQEAQKTPGQPGRPANAEGAVVATAKRKARREYRINAEAILLTYQGFSGLDSWLHFVGFIQARLKMWQVTNWCATLETNKDGTLHAHVMLQFRCQQDKTAATFAYQGLRPNVRTTDLCGEGLCRKRLQSSINRGMFYVWANKIGTQRMPDGSLCVAGNYTPCWTEGKCTYMVDARWPETLWKQRKVSHAMWKEYLYECRTGVIGRKRNLDAVMEQEAREARKKEIAERIKRIRANPGLYRPFPVVPSAQEWLALFKADALRYPILIVIGRSSTGKTEWAKSLFKNPLLLRIGTLEHFPDAMRSFGRELHDGIVMDDIRDLLFLHAHQDKIQGKYEGEVEFASTLGGQCAYYHDLYAVPFVATVNYSTVNLDALQTNDFLSLPSNRVVVEWPPATEQA